ncbi:hypothetical protein [Caldibacillus debilis]|uniref:hypothetical protein n=1 Tax=Caldibacillus debilis TaxID=301148 RepID=UPI0023EFAB89|nr:hypothetical protein [Caldibacillus debilis]
MEKRKAEQSIHPAVLSNRENTLRCLQGIFLKSPFSASKKRHFCHEAKASREPGMKKSRGSVPVTEGMVSVRSRPAASRGDPRSGARPDPANDLLSK